MPSSRCGIMLLFFFYSIPLTVFQTQVPLRVFEILVNKLIARVALNRYNSLELAYFDVVKADAQYYLYVRYSSCDRCIAKCKPKTNLFLN